MTEIEQKALALVNEVAKEFDVTPRESIDRRSFLEEVVCRAIEQHEQFKREVSDAVEASMLSVEAEHRLRRFIIPKPDPLVEALCEVRYSPRIRDTAEIADDLRAALAKRGLEVREIEKRADR